MNTDIYGRTELDILLLQKDPDLNQIKVLLDNGSDPLQEYNGSSSLDTALGLVGTEYLSLLLRYANRKINITYVYTAAMCYCDYDKVEMLLPFVENINLPFYINRKNDTLLNHIINENNTPEDLIFRRFKDDIIELLQLWGLAAPHPANE